MPSSAAIRSSVGCTSGVTGCSSSSPALTVDVPGGLWIAQTPSDVETFGLTYQRGAWDAAFFNKRIGTEYMDNGAYHNQGTIDPFDLSNIFVNYTIRGGSRFNGTKIRFSVNNLFNSHAINGITYSNSAVANNITANGSVQARPSMKKTRGVKSSSPAATMEIRPLPVKLISKPAIVMATTCA